MRNDVGVLIKVLDLYYCLAWTWIKLLPNRLYSGNPNLLRSKHVCDGYSTRMRVVCVTGLLVSNKNKNNLQTYLNQTFNLVEMMSKK